MTITVRQIAARAHVSASTVSRVLNGFPHVDEMTRACVLQAARELGYPLPATLSTGRGGRTVLLLQRDMGAENDPAMSFGARDFEYEVSRGMQPVFEKNGITMRLQRTRMETSEIPAYIHDAGASGLLLMGGIQNHDFVRGLQATGVPFVVVGSHMSPLDVNCVMPDYMNGTCQAIKHLASTGRQRIGLISGPPTTTSSEEKYNGYRLGLTLCDLPFDASQVLAADFDADSGNRQTRALLGQHPDLDAIVYAMDDQALGGLLALKESGRRVPDDVAIVGFYDHDVARFTDPPLSSVRIDWPPIGAVAARRLCMMIDSPDDQTCTIVKPTTLVVRESSMAPRQMPERRAAHAAT